MRDEVSSASGIPEKGFEWILEVEDPRVTLEDLYDSTPFQSLDGKLSAALSHMLVGDLARKIALQKEEAASRKTLVKGRQILRTIFEHYKVSAEDNTILGLQNLLQIKMVGDL